MKRAALLCFILAGCKMTVDPDKGRYSCMSDADCGDGYECWAQFSGGSLCFPKGQCSKPELCNGKDDNCDGRVDESFPESAMACMTGGKGPCGPGVDQCIDGGVVCISPYVPHDETCNGIDDDCNGNTDETFNFATDNANCGRCMNACSSGAACGNGVCFETNCADGLDNDNDGGADCLDPACNAKACGGDDGGFACGRRLFDGGMDAGTDDAGLPDAGMSDAGESDGGADAGVDAGPPLEPACLPRETACDNMADDDLDGFTDCTDPDCDSLSCASGMTCVMGICQ